MPDKTQTRRKGRPSKYKPEFVDQARKLSQFGATDDEMAQFFGVAISTLYLWKVDHADFSEAIKDAKATADERVKNSLYHKAIGYTFDAVKIFMPAGAKKPVYAPYREHVAPDTTAAIFWLKNRCPEEWRDRQQHEHTGKDGAPLVPILNVTIGGNQSQPAPKAGDST